MSDAKLRPAPAQPMTAEKFAPIAKAPPPEAAKPDDRPVFKSEPVKPNDRPVYKPVAGDPDSMVSETGLKVAKARVKEVKAEPVHLPTSIDYTPPKARRPSVVNPQAQPAQVAADSAKVENPAPLSEIGKAIDAQAELERFQATLNGANADASADGSPGKERPAPAPRRARARRQRHAAPRRRQRRQATSRRLTWNRARPNWATRVLPSAMTRRPLI